MVHFQIPGHLGLRPARRELIQHYLSELQRNTQTASLHLPAQDATILTSQVRQMVNRSVGSLGGAARTNQRIF